MCLRPELGAAEKDSGGRSLSPRLVRLVGSNYLCKAGES
jgi:hypothetical protein